MNKKLTLAILLFAVLCLTIVGIRPVRAVSAGVAPGNEFTYKLQAIFSSSDSSVQVPANIQQLNLTDWYKVTITAVSGADVTLNTTWRFTNGTEINRVGHVNLETSIYDGDFWAVFASNLNPNDLIRPLGPGRITLNETVNRGYPGGERMTNHLSIDATYYNSNDASKTYVDYTSIYFDKQTGMLVQLQDQSVYNTPDYTITIIWEITDSNVWTVPEFLIILVLPLFMIATAFAVIAIKKKHVNVTGKLAPTQAY